MTKEEAVEVLRKTADVIVETCREAGPDGAPAGPLYAALMGLGMTLEQFELLMGTLARAGRLKRVGYHCYTVVAQETALPPPP